MIDLHLHLLPGVDDGPADLAAALALARECCATGTALVAATPHYDEWTRAALPDAATAVDHVCRLQAELDRAAIPLRVLAGGEAFLTPDLPREVRAGRVPTIAGTPWLLVEAPVQQMPLYLDHVFFELQTMGIMPLLAHPERYLWLHRNPDILGELVARGVRAQVTAASLTGRAGRQQRALAETLVRRGWVQVIATDWHRADSGSSLRNGYAAALALVGEECARRLVETHPGLVVAGQPIPVSLTDEAHRHSWLRRWLRR
jgi:protein-tyrosine phosphatase